MERGRERHAHRREGRGRGRREHVRAVSESKGRKGAAGPLYSCRPCLGDTPPHPHLHLHLLLLRSLHHLLLLFPHRECLPRPAVLKVAPLPARISRATCTLNKARRMTLTHTLFVAFVYRYCTATRTLPAPSSLSIYFHVRPNPTCSLPPRVLVLRGLIHAP
ncbi:hypothetical protein BHM03_00044172 [Ensete ventricosum]|nr:hypothetical protein BHM03_00044172 [Ensete ventricosum]